MRTHLRVRGRRHQCFWQLKLYFVFNCQARVICCVIKAFHHVMVWVAGPAINHFQQVESQGAVFWVPLLLAIGIAESYRVAVGWNDPTSSQFYSLRDDYEPGNLGFDPLGLLPDDPKEQYDMKSKEINNGRLAMIAVAGFVAQELRDGQPIFNSLGGRVLGTVEKTN